MSFPQCIEGCPQHETRVRHKQRHRSRTVSKTSLRRSKLSRSGQANPRFEGERNPSTLPKNRKRGGCRGARGSRGVWGGSRKFQGRSKGGSRNRMASLLRSNIQDFVQEVPVGQMAQGTPFQAKRKGEVTPCKCPTRHPRVGG